MRAPLAAFAVLLAQTIVVTSPGQEAFRSAADVLHIESVVVSRTGDPIRGLTRDDFEVFVDGRGRAVISSCGG